MALFLALPLAYAQTITTGDVAGTVTDASGAVIPSATMTLKSVETGETQTTTTSQSGAYRFTLLKPGNYIVEASTSGMKSDATRVAVEVGQALTVDLVAKVQSTQQVVEVTAAPALLNVENANLSTAYDSRQLENLPAPGNDMTAYAYTAPGVTISTGGGYGNFSVFGLPGVSNLFTVNGNDNMDPYLNLNNSGASNLTLGSNELSEAAVVVNGYTGQYGRQAGANVNYVTKSGTNEFHGNLAWYWNGRYMNANDFFNNATGTPRPFSISNQWADSIGGPILKNKLFFFIDNEGIQYSLAAGGPVYFPTTDFSNFVLAHLQATNTPAVPLYTTAMNLYAGASGAGRATPVTTAIDPYLGCGDIISGGVPTDSGALAAYSAGFGTTRPCARTFQSTVNNQNKEWLLAVRGDYNLTSTDHMYLRYNQDHGTQPTYTDPINPAFNAVSNQPQYGGQFGYTKTISASMVNQLLLSASYYSAFFSPDLKAALNAFPTTWAFNDGLYSSNSSGTSLSDDTRYPQGRKVRQWQVVDDYSIIHGSHSIKIGTNIRKNWVSTYAYGANTSGLMTFNSMTDFLDGSLVNGSTYAQAFSSIGAEGLNLYSAGFYGQDEWKVRPNLTLTLALRLDRNSNIQCPSGCFNELLGQPFGQVNHSVTQPYNAVIEPRLHEAFPSVEPIVAEPRVGFAWNPEGSTVLRGGFGIFSDLYQGLIADRLVTNAPAVTSFTTSSGLVALNDPTSAFAIVANSNAAFQNGFASGQTRDQMISAGLLAVPNFNTVANKLYNPKFYEWNFEVQQGFGGNKYMVSVNYVGNKGYQEINQTLFANQYSKLGFQGLPTSAPDARFGEIRELNSQGWSNYNGLVTAFKWRMSSQFSGSFSYTWSHALDTCSNECLEPFVFTTNTSLRYQVSPANLRALNYGSADYDVRNSLNANYVYTVPTSYFHNSLLKGVLGGWTVAGTFFYHSGYPFSIVNSAVRSAGGVKNATGIATQTFLADGVPTTTTCTTPNVACFDTSQFLTDSSPAWPQLNYGTLGRNSFRGPGYFDTDMNVNKTFAIHERFRLLIGAYFFNILNHPNFDQPVNNLAAGNVGVINSSVSAPSSAYGSFQGSAVSGRVIQTQVKLTF
ncbi:MAG: carboxypeptidase regulatory-like domain-containing protein [Acidobacteriaceae bacterium]|nr:carboxypeptidase regulatory-like domain-containing protein [Acidobacteriaceae bacterium]